MALGLKSYGLTLASYAYAGFLDSAISLDRIKINVPKNIPVISSVPKLKETERWPGGLLKVTAIVTNASVSGLTRVLQRSMEANLPKYIEF